MSFTHKRLSIGLLLFSIVVLVLNVGSVGAQDGSTLRVGILEPVNLDPATGSADDEVIINRHIYDYLIEILPDGSLEPSLAASWETSEDGLTYTFTLLDGVTFHDGSAFTAADAVFTFSRLVEVGSPAVGLLGQTPTGEKDADGNDILRPTWTVAASGFLTVVFTLEQPNADFLYGVGSRFAPIVKDGNENVNVLGEDGSTANFNGTGPFILQELDAGEGATLVANENYWGGRPTLDTLEFIFINDTNTQVSALRSGDVDFIYKIPTDLLSQIEGDSNITITTVATNTHPVIRIRSDEGHLGEDVRIRQAFKHATDRELLNLDTLDGRGAVGNNDPIGPVYGPLYNPQDGLEYDPQLACDLLAEYAAENPDNAWVTMDGDTPSLAVDFYVAEAFEYPLLAEFMQQQWQEGCINVNLIIRPENIYYGDNEWMDVDLGLTGWATRPTPQAYLGEAYVTGAVYNESHWSNAELDELAAAASVTSDQAERAEIYNQIANIFEQEGPIIVPFFRPVAGAYRNNVQGLVMNPFPGSTDFSNVTVVGE
jgi:peptide/nickel transport system substrate-binding protein